MQLIDRTFDDIDAMADAALEWDQKYEQLGRGRFSGRLRQLVLSSVQLNRETWTPGVLHQGAAPKASWVFGLPLKAKGSLHVRRRRVEPGEMLAATSHDDIGFSANGPTELMIVVLPNRLIRRWMRARRGKDGVNPELPPRQWTVSPLLIRQRALSLSNLLNALSDESEFSTAARLQEKVEATIIDTILDAIPSAEFVDALHTRALIARKVLQVLYDRREEPLGITELCELVGARERTLYLSCVEAFGRPPAQLLLEIRLNAVRRLLRNPKTGQTVSGAATEFGFIHFGRFSEMYTRQFGELPSVTLAKAIGH